MIARVVARSRRRAFLGLVSLQASNGLGQLHTPEHAAFPFFCAACDGCVYPFSSRQIIRNLNVRPGPRNARCTFCCRSQCRIYWASAAKVRRHPQTKIRALRSEYMRSVPHAATRDWKPAPPKYWRMNAGHDGRLSGAGCERTNCARIAKKKKVSSWQRVVFAFVSHQICRQYAY